MGCQMDALQPREAKGEAMGGQMDPRGRSAAAQERPRERPNGLPARFSCAAPRVAWQEISQMDSRRASAVPLPG